MSVTTEPWCYTKLDEHGHRRAYCRTCDHPVAIVWSGKICPDERHRHHVEVRAIRVRASNAAREQRRGTEAVARVFSAAPDVLRAVWTRASDGEARACRREWRRNPYPCDCSYCLKAAFAGLPPLPMQACHAESKFGDRPRGGGVRMRCVFLNIVQEQMPNRTTAEALAHLALACT